MMKKYVDEIINRTNYSASCDGLQAADAATSIANHYFEDEGLSFDGWRVREIPVVDDSGKYPVAIALRVDNQEQQREISLNITRNGELYSVCPDETAIIELVSIRKAIEHPTSKCGGDDTEDTTSDEEMKSALLALKDAFLGVLQASDYETEFDSLKYPFDCNFKEMVNKVVDWVGYEMN